MQSLTTFNYSVVSPASDCPTMLLVRSSNRVDIRATGQKGVTFEHVTAYGSSSITATSWWTATVTNAQAYAYPIEGYASGVAELKSILTNGDSTATESGSSSSAAAATYTVLAGTNPAFVPNSVSAEVGDIVLFQFTSGNHSVTESTFDHPCVRLPDGYDSGYMPNPNNAVVPTPEYSINISQNSSRWFYSKQSGECGSGMIFALNPSNEQTAKLFQLNAISQNGTSTESSAGMSTGVKVGVSIAAVTGAALILGLFFLFRRHRRNSTENATGSEYQAVGKTGRSGSGYGLEDHSPWAFPMNAKTGQC
ncbi:unnamed protein product [Diplocarpon coronariae]